MKEKLFQLLAQRTPREKAMLAGAAILLLVAVVYPTLVEPIQAAFARQTSELDSLTKTYDLVPKVLERYQTLQARRAELEKFYSEINVSEDPLAYLEKLIRDVAQAKPGEYGANPREGATRGDRYTTKSFNAHFQTTSMENLSAFLKALTTGSQPMLLSSISLERRGSGETLYVQFEVSAFEPNSK